jgi:hypothetical protein
MDALHFLYLQYNNSQTVKGNMFTVDSQVIQLLPLLLDLGIRDRVPSTISTTSKT